MKKILLIMLSFCTIVLIQNCSNTKKTAVAKVAVVSFGKNVLPILQSRCTPCHFPPEGRKQALNTYDDAKANISEMIARVKLPQEANGFMPWKNKKPALSDSMINVLVEWQKQNMPQ